MATAPTSSRKDEWARKHKFNLQEYKWYFMTNRYFCEFSGRVYLEADHQDQAESDNDIDGCEKFAKIEKVDLQTRKLKRARLIAVD